MRMQTYLIITIMALMSLCLLPAALGPVVPSGISSYAAIQLTNNQATAFASNSQIMLTVNSLSYKPYEASGLQNIEFFYANGTVIPSWLEGNALNEAQTANLYTDQNTIYWLRLYPANSLLPAASSNSIYMGFASNATNLLSNTVTGEAPKLSSSYGQYDNGASVFSFYTNFKGPGTPSGFSTYSSTPGFSSGITFTTSDGGFYYSTQVAYPMVIEDYYIQPTLSGATNYPETALSFAIDTATSSFVYGKGYAYIYADAPGSGKFAIESWSDSGATRSTLSSFSQYPTANTLYGFAWTSTGNQVAYTNYATEATAANTLYPIANYIAVLSEAAGGSSYSAQWFRGRAYPPNGIMPSEQFTLFTPPTISIANAIISNSIDVVAGSPSDHALITASCQSGDTCQIDASNGLSLASGTTTATLAYNSLPLGYSSLYANDITGNLPSSKVSVRRIVQATELKLTFTNTQSSPEPANASIIIAYNALAHTSIEANTLNNTAIAFQNGTVAYSWLEGNVSGEENPAPKLIKSENVTYWLKGPPSNSFLPADTGNTVSNSVYLIFASPTTNLLDGNFIGEAPQLSCLTGTFMSCSGGIYAQYDNGGSIFYYYTNFAGTTVPPGWNTAETASLVVNNGISFTGAATGGKSAQMTLNATYPRPLSIDVLSENEGTNPVYDIGYVDNTGVFQNGYQISGGGGNQYNVFKIVSGSSSQLASGTATSTIWNVATLGLGLLSLHDEVAYALFSTANDTTFNNYHPFFGSWWNDKTVYAQWFRLRSSYDSNVSLSPPEVLPSSYVNPTMAAPSPSSQSVAQGGSATINDTGLLNGTSPYTYQWYAAYNGLPTKTSANALEANTLLGIGTTLGEAQSNTVIFSTNSLTTTGSYGFKLYGQDSIPNGANSTNANIIVTAQTVVTSSGGGGNSPPTYGFTISDNITSKSASQTSVVEVGGSSYGQSQLPVTVSSGSRSLSVTFACTVQIANATYSYQNDIYGVGFGVPCGSAYNDTTSSITVAYSLQQVNTTTSTSSVTTTSSTSPTSVSTSSATTTSVSSITTTIFEQPKGNITPIPYQSGSGASLAGLAQAISRLHATWAGGLIALILAILLLIIFLTLRRRRKKR
jgi:hypothetical protein